MSLPRVVLGELCSRVSDMTSIDPHDTVHIEDTPHAPSTAANIANNVTLLLISRGAVVIAPFLLAAFGWLTLQYLDGRFQEQTVRIETVQAKVAVIDNAAEVAADRASKAASDLTQTKQALMDEQAQAAQFRVDTRQQLDKTTDTLVTISNTLAGVNAKIETWHRQGQP